MYKNTILTIVGFLVITGCAGSKTKPLTNKDLPDWYLNPPKYEDRFVGVGDAHVLNSTYPSRSLQSVREWRSLEL